MAQVYIAGPMRGLPRWNFDAFYRAEAEWRAAGWNVASPASIDRAIGFDPDGSDEQVTREFMLHAGLRDIVLIFSSQAIALLPGWESSTGATMELSLALFLGLDVYDAVTRQPLQVNRLPWKTDADKRRTMYDAR